MKPWSRVRERDKFGFIAFELTFVAETPQPIATSATYLATLVSAGIDDLAAATIALAASVALVAAPAYLAAAAAADLSDAIVSIETVRAETPVAPAQAGTLAAAVRALFIAAPAAASTLSGLDGSFVAGMIATSRALAAAANSPTTASAFTAAAAAFAAAPAPASTPTYAPTVAQNATLIGAIGRLALLAGALDAAIAAPYSSRPAAAAMRAALVARIDAETDVATDLRAVGLLVALSALRGRLCDWFAFEMTSLAPIVIVRSATSLPSLVLAWSLYQDISRARELVDRNDVAHPSFMPEQIEARAA
jgi:hypothetical protein